MPKNSNDIIKNEFSKYLDTLGVSLKSHKNYRSDLSHFTAWVIFRIRAYGAFVETLTQAVPFINRSIAEEYKKFMMVNKHPVKSINRRLSTLRHFSKFLLTNQSMNSDFMHGLENISLVVPKLGKTKSFDVLDDFKLFLESQNVSPNTLKSYISDVKQFISWMESEADSSGSV